MPAPYSQDLRTKALEAVKGDGHPGVWKVVAGIRQPQQRREVLDWFHLMENLHKVGGFWQRLIFRQCPVQHHAKQSNGERHRQQVALKRSRRLLVRPGTQGLAGDR